MSYVEFIARAIVCAQAVHAAMPRVRDYDRLTSNQVMEVIRSDLLDAQREVFKGYVIGNDADATQQLVFELARKIPGILEANLKKRVLGK